VNLLKNSPVTSPLLVITAVLILGVGCSKTKYQTEQPPVSLQRVEPRETPRTDLTDTRAPYSVDQPVAPRVQLPPPTPVPTPAPTPAVRSY
jgi:hypothetical protein